MLALTPMDTAMLVFAFAALLVFIAVVLWVTVSNKRDADRRLRAVFDNFSRALVEAGTVKRRQMLADAVFCPKFGAGVVMMRGSTADEEQAAAGTASGAADITAWPGVATSLFFKRVYWLAVGSIRFGTSLERGRDPCPSSSAAHLRHGTTINAKLGPFDWRRPRRDRD